MRDARYVISSSGNHIWAKREGLGLLEGDESTGHPAGNYPPIPRGGMPLATLGKNRILDKLDGSGIYEGVARLPFPHTLESILAQTGSEDLRNYH